MIFILFIFGVIPHHGLALPSSMPETLTGPSSNPKGWTSISPSAGWPSPSSSIIGASSVGSSSFSSDQATNSGQTFIINAVGPALSINLNSVTTGEAVALMGQEGSQSSVSENDEIAAIAEGSSVSTYVAPTLQADIDIHGASDLGLTVSSHAVGTDQIVHSELGQQVEAVHIEANPVSSGSGGWSMK